MLVQESNASARSKVSVKAKPQPAAAAEESEAAAAAEAELLLLKQGGSSSASAALARMGLSASAGLSGAGDEQEGSAAARGALHHQGSIRQEVDKEKFMTPQMETAMAGSALQSDVSDSNAYLLSCIKMCWCLQIILSAIN